MTLHQMCEQARHVACTPCGATADTPCQCQPGGYHLARFAVARRAGFISRDDFASLIRGSDVILGVNIVADPAGVTS